MSLRPQAAVLVLSLANGPLAYAQSFNVDVGTGTATPAAVYAGAANQPGLWNVHPGQDAAPFPLFDLTGQPTGVTLQMPLPFGPASFDYPGTSGGDEALLDDYFDLRSTPATFEIVGLQPGEYGVYTYAWAPDDATFKTTVQVNGQNPVLIGGGWPGRLTEGAVYAHHWVAITSTQSIQIYTYGRPKGTLNGLQIVLGENPPPRDGGVVDGEEEADVEEDATVVDAGPTDSGASFDAADAGRLDTGLRDSGMADSGVIVDAGVVGDVVEDSCGCATTRKHDGDAALGSLLLLEAARRARKKRRALGPGRWSND
jgi:hypothetical protein